MSGAGPPDERGSPTPPGASSTGLPGAATRILGKEAARPRAGARARCAHVRILHVLDAPPLPLDSGRGFGFPSRFRAPAGGRAARGGGGLRGSPRRRAPASVPGSGPCPWPPPRSCKESRQGKHVPGSPPTFCFSRYSPRAGGGPGRAFSAGVRWVRKRASDFLTRSPKKSLPTRAFSPPDIGCEARRLIFRRISGGTINLARPLLAR